jgi:hypothetical protein
VLAGHFGLAAAVKSQERQVPLWALMLATGWLDVIFPLYLSGIETIEIAPGTAVGYGSAIIHADYTHSLIGALALARSSVVREPAGCRASSAQQLRPSHARRRIPERSLTARGGDSRASCTDGWSRR